MHVQRWCAGMTHRGFQIKLISVGGRQLDSVETVVLLRRGKLSYLTNIARAKEETIAFNPNLVHAHYIAGNGLLARKTGVTPFLGSVWGADVIDLPTNIIFRHMVRKILRAATYLTATSNFLKQVTIKLEPTVANRISVIPFGVKIPDDFYVLPSFKPVKICFVKSLKPKYGADILLQALKQVTAKIPDIQLTIAGAGPMENELKALTKKLQLETNVSFVGYVENEQVYELIHNHHMMVMPSIMDSESFGVAAIESGACGRPVIASRVGGVPEVIIDGKTGILVTPLDIGELAKAIVKLADNITLCNDMGKCGYQHVKENYPWEKSLDQMSELYGRLIYESQKS